MNQTISDFFDEPGPVGRRRMKVVTVVGVLAFAAILVWMCSVLASKGQFDASKWTPFLEASTWRAYYIPGIIGTLKAAAVAIISRTFWELSWAWRGWRSRRRCGWLRVCW